MMSVVVEVRCVDAPLVEHAHVNHVATTFGDHVTYSCDEGFYLVQGNGRLLCGPRGHWEGEPTVCQGWSSVCDCYVNWRFIL